MAAYLMSGLLPSFVSPAKRTSKAAHRSQARASKRKSAPCVSVRADKVLRTDKLLEAWADKRMGGASIENVDVFWWGDAKNVMDNGANGLDQRLVLLGTQQTALTATAN
jgi:hypothetical protein